MRAQQSACGALILLAAGRGERMGQPKGLLAGADGEPLLQSAAIALALGSQPHSALRLAVVSDHRTHALAESLGWQPVWQTAPERGMLHSVQVALRQAQAGGAALDWVLLHPVDVPLHASWGADLVSVLIEALLSGAGLVSAAWRGAPGHPVGAGGARVAALLEAHAECTWLRQALGSQPMLIDSPHPDVVENLNTPADYERWLGAATQENRNMLMDRKIEVLLSAEDIAARVRELGAEITRDYAGKDLTLVAVLKGSFLFVADLVRAIDLPCQVDFLGLSSYGAHTKSSGVVKITSDLTQPVEGKHVLVVEDIVDTGLTINYLLENLATRRPASVKVCSLLHKPANQKVEVPIDYKGFTIDDLFVIGYGLDLAELYRNLPYIGHVVG